MAQIKNRVYKTELVEWKKVNDLQPDNLKISINHDSIKQSIIKYGVSKAYDICEIEGQLYWLDGHTRTDILIELENEGHKIPKKLTANFIQIKDKAEAIMILLEVHNQKQNPMERGVVIEMLEMNEIEELSVAIETLHIAPEIHITNKNKELNQGDFENQNYSLKLEFSEEQYNYVTEKLKGISETPESILYNALVSL